MQRVAWLPDFARGDRQKCQRSSEQEKVEESLGTRPEQARAEMRISISGQEHNLEEQHAGSPNTGTTAEPWENIFADNRLHLKEQERTGEDRQRIRGHVEAILPRRARGTIHNLTGKRFGSIVG